MEANCQLINVTPAFQAKLVDQYDLERKTWSDESFPLLNYYRVAHGAVPRADGKEIYVMGGSAKTSENFGPGLEEMEVLTMDKEDPRKVKK